MVLNSFFHLYTPIHLSHGLRWLCHSDGLPEDLSGRYGQSYVCCLSVRPLLCCYSSSPVFMLHIYYYSAFYYASSASQRSHCDKSAFLWHHIFGNVNLAPNASDEVNVDALVHYFIPLPLGCNLRFVNLSRFMPVL